MNSRPSLLDRPASVMPTAGEIALARFHAAVNTLLLSARAVPAPMRGAAAAQPQQPIQRKQ